MLVVQNRTADRTPHGTEYTPSGEPVTVRGSLQPLSAAESNVDGLVALTQRRWISRSWPGTILSLCTAADGSKWEPVGEPQHYAMSPSTDHWEVVLKKVG